MGDSDQQQHQWSDLWASGTIVLAVIVFLVMIWANLSWEKASLCLQGVYLNDVYIHTGGRFAAKKIGSYSIKDLILSVCPHGVHLCTAETTALLHFFLCMCLWYISAVLPYVLVYFVPFWWAPSLLPTVTKSHFVSFISSVDILLLWR